MILGVIAIQERHNTWGAIRTIGRPGLLAAIGSTQATTLYINAFRHSSVADATGRLLVGAAMSAPRLVIRRGFDVSPIDLFKLFLFGTTQFGLGLVFLTVGGQMVSATENALINTLETPLAVAWVWSASLRRHPLPTSQAA
jgi:drug/metabolite transporter (DMT)-like permease